MAGDTEHLRSESEKSVTARSNNKALNEKLLRGLIHDRAAIMAEYMSKELAKSPATSHFLAVGAGHCIAENSIIDRLARSGYKISRVAP